MGPAVARILSEEAPDDVSVIVSQGEPAGLIDAWTNMEAVFLVDACVSGGGAGTIQRFDAVQSPLPEQFDAISTHGFGVSAAIELARAIGNLPRRLIVYGIEASEFEPGTPLSTSAQRAAQEVAGRIREELSHIRD
ncbi:MAG: hydrogenase maturation protease [Parvibaculum sp.]